MALHTLRAMASGGMYDQVGGGFSRYSVDARWIVPHFEKMLYDNALLARAYLHGWQVTGEPLFRRVCEETLDWALRELRQEEGGFASRARRRLRGRRGQLLRLDARELRDALGDELADGGDRALRRSTEAGNFEGASIPVRADAASPSGCAEIKAAAAGGARAARAPGARRQAADRLERADDLRARRGRRRARARRLPRRRARRRPSSCSRDLRDGDGRLLRTYNRGRAKLAAYLEDHAFLLEALLTLYEATFDAALVREARGARRHDPRALRRRRARRLLRRRRRPRAADRAPQGPRGRADPVRRLVGRARPAAARRAHRRGALRGARRRPRSRCCTRSRRSTRRPSATCCRRSTSSSPRSRRSRSPARTPAARARGARGVPPARRAGRRRRRRRAAARGPRPVDGRAAAYVCERFAARRLVRRPAPPRIAAHGASSRHRGQSGSASAGFGIRPSKSSQMRRSSRQSKPRQGMGRAS